MRVKKYLNAKGYKLQILSDYSAFWINGGTKERNEWVHKELLKEEKKQIKNRNAQYYIIEDYMEPNYGILGVNVRVFGSKEIYDKYILDEKKAKEKAEKEHKKYLEKKVIWDKRIAEKEKEEDEIKERLYKSGIKNVKKIQIKFPYYDGEKEQYYGDFSIEVASKQVEKYLDNDNYMNYERRKRLLGKKYLTWKLVNEIVDWANENIKDFKLAKIDKNYNVRLPMAYCELDKNKYKYDTKEYHEAYKKLINYEAVAYDLKIIK